jgi:hypothetical protein
VKAAQLPRLVIARHFFEVSHAAMRAQYQRIIRSNQPALYDGYLFALALADLIRAAGVAAKETAAGPRIKVAIQEFPSASDFRNLLEYWPDYARGEGRDAGRLGLTPGTHWFWWDSVSPPVLRVGGSQARLVLDIAHSLSQGAKLYPIVHDALEEAIAAMTK